MEILKVDTYPLTSTTRGGTCSFCHVAQKADSNADTGLAPVYNLGIWIEMEGVLCICEDCAVLIGRAAGMLRESEAKARKSDVNRCEKRDRAIKDAQPAALEARDAIAQLVEAMGWE